MEELASHLEGFTLQSPQPGRVGPAPHLRTVSQFHGLNSSAAVWFGALNFIFRNVYGILIRETCYLYLNVSLRSQRIQPSSVQIILSRESRPLAIFKSYLCWSLVLCAHTNQKLILGVVYHFPFYWGGSHWIWNLSIQIIWLATWPIVGPVSASQGLGL